MKTYIKLYDNFNTSSTQNYVEKLNMLKNEIIEVFRTFIFEFGKESEFSNNIVIKITNDDFKFFLVGERYLTEISEEFLIDDRGYTYSFDTLDVEHLAELADALRNNDI